MKKINIMIILTLVMLLLMIVQTMSGLKDRASGTHNVGKVGFFTTNIGQWYPYGGQFEKTLEYPINSGHICMYRQCLMVGVPGNVVTATSGRHEEFDAICCYHAGKGKIAMSDDPSTWPSWGWPVQDEYGNPIFISQQDSYCAYSDSTNWRYYNNKEADMLLDIRVYQTIYSWGVPDADKFVVLKFEIENRSNRAHENFYFNIYSDLDIGGMNNEAREWADDCIDFDKSRELVYFYDSDNYSVEWGEPNPFLAGVTFLKTPNNLGITDWHWIDVMIDEVNVNSTHWDSVSYAIMCSDTMFFHNTGMNVGDYFHLGPNPINGTHYDDPNTTRITDENGKLIGGAMVAYICNGPVTIEAGKKVEYIIAIMVGDTKGDLLHVTDKIWEYYRDDFRVPTVPAPTLLASAGDRKVYLNWSNQLDVEYINPISNPKVNDLEGYRIYRTTDPSLRNWQVIAEYPMLYKNETTVRQNAYSHTDESGVYNGFTYYYCLTAYRTNPKTGKIEESVRLSDLKNIDNQPNAVGIQPESEAAKVKTDLDRIRAVPNPYVLSAQWDEARLGNSPFGEPLRNLAFEHLPTPCTIKIFTVDGDLVRTLYHNNPSGRAEWNLLTDENRPAVSGIYFFHVKSDLGEKVGRFAIIR